MAARTSQNVSENMDEKLDFLSAKFDPLKALYAENLRPPVSNIYIFNNLAQYAQAIKEGKIKSTESRKPAKASLRRTATRTRNLKPEYKPTEKETLQERLKSIAESNSASIVRNKTEKRAEGRADECKLQQFILAEEAFKAEQIKKKRMNVLDRMEACTEGPFSILHRCLTKRLRVKVWTRRYKGLRSVLAGYLVAFDKHMNLALFDVDEVYTLEERIEQPEDSTETQGTGKKKKKKRKKSKCQIEHKQFLEASNGETKDKNITVGSFDEMAHSSTLVLGQVASVNAEQSASYESPALQSICGHTGKETGTACKASFVLDSDSLGDNALRDVSMDTADEDSLAPSAEALNAALHGAAFRTNDTDGLFLVRLDPADEFSSEKCGSNVALKPRIESMSEKNEVDSPVTEIKSGSSVSATDSSNKVTGDCNTSLVVDGEEITGSRLCDSYTDEGKLKSIGNNSFQGERNSDITDLECYPSNIRNSDVSYVGADRGISSTTENNTHPAVRDGEENTFSDVLHESSCRTKTSDNCVYVTVCDRLLLKDKDKHTTELNQKLTQREHGDFNINKPLMQAGCSKDNREVEQTTDNSSDNETMFQESNFSESKPVMTKDSGMVDAKHEFVQGENLRGESETTEEYLIEPVNQLQDDRKEAKSQDDRKEMSTDACLEHSSMTDEMPSTEGIIGFPCSTLNDAQQIKRECLENFEISRSTPQNVSSEALVQSDTKKGSQTNALQQCAINETPPMEQVTAFTSLAPNFAEDEESKYLENVVDKKQSISGTSVLQRENEEEGWHSCSSDSTLRDGRSTEQTNPSASIVSELVLDEAAPSKDNGVLAWGNSHNEGTANMTNAEDQALDDEAVQMPEAKLLGCTTTNNVDPSAEATQRLIVDADTCGNYVKGPIKPLRTHIHTDSSRGALTLNNDDFPSVNKEGYLSSSICANGTSEIDLQVTLDQGTFRNSDQFGNSSDSALEIPLIVTNNRDVQGEENRILDRVASETAISVADKNINNFESPQKEAETVSVDVQHSAQSSDSGKGHSQCVGLRSGSDVLVSYRQVQYLCSNYPGQQTALSLGVCTSQQSGNVDGLPEDRNSEVSQTVQSEPSCDVVEETSLHSDPNKDSDKSYNLLTTQERLIGESSSQAMVLNTLEATSSDTVSSEGNMELAFDNSLKVPDKENDTRNESTTELFKNQANFTLTELKSNDDSPNDKRDFADCSKITGAGDNLGSNGPLQNTLVETIVSVSEVEREEGEISSDEEVASEGRILEKEKTKTLDDEAARSKENIETLKVGSKQALEAQELRKEEKEEGELSSSDSDAELLKTSVTQKGETSTSKSKLFDNRNVPAVKEKHLYPARRHSSSEGHHTLSRERLQLSARFGGKRRASSSAIVSTDLRTRLSRVRNKGNSSVKESGGREKRPQKVKGNVLHRGNDEKSAIKGGHKVEGKESTIKSREVQKHFSKTGSIKEDNFSGRQLKNDQLGHMPQSSTKDTKKYQRSSPSTKNVKKESAKGNKVESSPDDLHRTAKESDRKNVLKTSQPGLRQRTKETRKTSTRNVDSSTAVAKDVIKESTGRKKTESRFDVAHRSAKESKSKNVLKTTQLKASPKGKLPARKSMGSVASSAVVTKDHTDETKKLSKQPRAASQPKSKTNTRSKLDTENNSPDVKKSDMKKKMTGTMVGSTETSKCVHGSSVERSSEHPTGNNATKKKAKLATNTLSKAEKTAKGSKEEGRGLISSGGKALKKSEKLCSLNSRRNSVVGGVISKDGHSEEGKRKPVNASPRIIPNRTSKNSPANATPKAKVKPQLDTEISSENPRKRRRSTDGKEMRHGKKMRMDEVKSSLPKHLTAPFTSKLTQRSKRMNDCRSKSENPPLCRKAKVVESKIVPCGEEKRERAVEHECESESKGKNDKTDYSIPAKPILIGRNKHLVFRRRHVNQLFVRGDNVVMVAYAK